MILSLDLAENIKPQSRHLNGRWSIGLFGSEQALTVFGTQDQAFAGRILHIASLLAKSGLSGHPKIGSPGVVNVGSSGQADFPHRDSPCRNLKFSLSSQDFPITLCSNVVVSQVSSASTEQLTRSQVFT